MSVVRTKIPQHTSMQIVEHWTAETRQQLMDLLEAEEGRWPTRGYGTVLYNIKQDPTGVLWHAEFSRYTSCD